MALFCGDGTAHLAMPPSLIVDTGKFRGCMGFISMAALPRIRETVHSCLLCFPRHGQVDTAHRACDPISLPSFGQNGRVREMFGQELAGPKTFPGAFLGAITAFLPVAPLAFWGRDSGVVLRHGADLSLFAPKRKISPHGFCSGYPRDDDLV